MGPKRLQYSYRDDPQVPVFADDKPLIVFDGVCVLCSGFARFVVNHDPGGRFRLTTAQSPLGQALYRHFDLDPLDFETNLLIADGRASTKLDAFAGIMDRLGGRWRLAKLARITPRPIGNWLYDRIARNRYQLFGRTETCMVPPSDWAERVL